MTMLLSMSGFTADETKDGSSDGTWRHAASLLAGILKFHGEKIKRKKVNEPYNHDS
jgi:hypothetical protein